MAERRPNIVLILNDDMGYSDLGCYGGEVRTPNLDGLAADGLRLTQFYNTPRCSPSRASLLTGLHPHQTGIGILTDDDGPEGYAGTLNRRCVTMAEVLRAAGYATYMSGKWHLAHDVHHPNDAWPNQRGFDHHYGTIIGGGSYFAPTTLRRDNEDIDHEVEREGYFYTDAISDHAAAFLDEHAREAPDRPFLLYVAYTAPHWPLHAKPEDIALYQGRFDAGWDALREERQARMIRMGILDERWRLSPRDPGQPPWERAEHKQWETRRMEVYAAQIDCMDQGIGRIVRALERSGQLDNTLILFLADNGGCAEVIGEDWARWLSDASVGRSHTRAGRAVRFGNVPGLMPGGEDTYQSYGVAWANLSNTPFRMYKHWTEEGGISTPLIAHWPAGISATAAGELRRQPAQLTDVMATVLQVTGAAWPATFAGEDIPPCEGESLRGIFESDRPRKGMLFWEHEGNAAVRDGRWKLVRNFEARASGTPGFDPPERRGEWELYDVEVDRTELHDLAGEQPQRVATMAAAYEQWAARCGVIDRERILDIYRRRGSD